MNHQYSQSRKVTNDTPEIIYECGCSNKKKIKVVYDGGFGDKFTVEYCEKCYDQEDKKFEISMEIIS